MREITEPGMELLLQSAGQTGGQRWGWGRARTSRRDKVSCAVGGGGRGGQGTESFHCRPSAAGTAVLMFDSELEL